jgi:hypothetical protein
MFGLFGPSKFDQLLTVLREDRAAQAATTAAQLALLTTFVEGARAQTELAVRQFALLAPPTTAPNEVRMRTPAIEADLERQYLNAKAPHRAESYIDPAQILSDLQREFDADQAGHPV